MTAKRPTFRVMKNGYDRFAVDDTMESYISQIDALEKRISLYQAQLAQTSNRLEQLQKQYDDLNRTMESKQAAADDIARLSLREASEIIATANQNADEIIREALSSARLLLADMSRLYNQADVVKGDVSEKIDALREQIDRFELPRMPDMRWLQEAEDKLR